MRAFTVSLAALVWFILAPVLIAQEEPTVDFEQTVWPLLVERCHHCHGEDEQEGQLRLDSRAIVFGGGISGPAVTPGNPGESLLLQRLLGEGDQDQMPSDDDPLSEEEIASVRQWIESGADWPRDVGVENAELELHWAYVPPQRPELPTAADTDWSRNAIDHFVLARLQEEGLAPSEEADRERLLRRVYLDLIGIPPSIEQIDAFLVDDSPDAHERVVDQLLASPQYGEKWARQWLDLARYADSNGYQRDGFRDMWAYRDWVIGAMNADMPYDQFTIEQLAGDLLPEATNDQRVATGFHRCTTANVEAGTDQEENRVNQIIDRVNTTATVWLGTTLECAQCHNHKYDPFTQRDYYQIFAFFNNTPMETRFRTERATAALDFTDAPSTQVPLTAEQEAESDALQMRLAQLQQQLEQQRETALAGFTVWQQETQASLNQSLDWQVLELDEFTSAGGSTHRLLDDDSVLVGGAQPDKDTFTITYSGQGQRVAALRLEALTHASLPSQGPGRHVIAQRPNFVLNEMTISVLREGQTEPAETMELHAAAADFSPDNYSASKAIDGDRATGWAIHSQFGESHWATFQLQELVELQAGDQLTLKLEFLHGGSRTIGRLRVSTLPTAPEVFALPENMREILETAPQQRTDEQRETLRDYYLSQQSVLTETATAIEEVRKQISALRPETTLVMQELDQPRDTFIFQRGNFLSPTDQVFPETPAILPPMDDNLPANRLGLARWVASPDNPLTARVAVNRWWAEFFGHGLVPSLEDLGSQAEPPTHPELLDWLAVELMEQDWSMKSIHRRIVTSATYRQSSSVSPELLEADPNNTVYARGPRFRLSAETIRDCALAAAGQLSLEMGGPPVYPPQPPNVWRVTGVVDNNYRTSEGTDRYRRGIYVIWRRSAPYPSFVNFDAPDRASCVVYRSRTNTPLQALTLMNDPVFVEAATALSTRMIEEVAEGDVEDRIEHGFRLCLTRRPTEREVLLLMNAYQRELERRADDESAAWRYVATILLNLDETITKN